MFNGELMVVQRCHRVGKVTEGALAAGEPNGTAGEVVVVVVGRVAYLVNFWMCPTVLYLTLERFA